MSSAPTGFQAPKTNWASADVPLPGDFNRIEGNLNAIETGSRTLDPAQAPTGNVGSLRQLLDWFANRIRAISGTTNWYDDPPVSLNNVIPRGVIVMWSGSVAGIPQGWALCDGTNGTPDLRDRFIVGAGNSYAVGATGGVASHNLSHAHSFSGTTGTPVQGTDRSTGPDPAQLLLNHRHDFSGTTTSWLGSIDNRPPYYALCFIMKL